MESFLNSLLEFTNTISNNIWWPYIIIILFSCGIYLTWQSGFIQFRRLGLAIKFMFKSSNKDSLKDSEGEITPFQALMTALAATVGNGNIAGVATAIVAGGIGAPFWMWMTALIGMATKYSEGLLGLKYRKKNEDGTYGGGAMYYLESIRHKKLGKVLAVWFALALIFMSTLGSGNMAQSNSIALALQSDFGIEFSYTAIGLFIVCGIILIGGIKRIASFSEKLVPSMIVLYMGTGLIILISNIHLVPEIFSAIIDAAFSTEAVGGGIIGHTIKEAMRFGASRGTLSSESGIGSCSIPAAAAKGNESAAQGLVAMMGTFIDTIVVCSMSAFIIVSSDLYSTGLDSVALTKSAFTFGLGSDIGGTIVSIASAIFGFTTLIGYAYIGEQGFRYIFKKTNVNIFRITFIIFVAIGSMLQGKYLQIVWNFGDIANALMLFPNVIGLFFLGKVIKSETKDYFGRWDNGELNNPFGDK